MILARFFWPRFPYVFRRAAASGWGSIEGRARGHRFEVSVSVISLASGPAHAAVRASATAACPTARLLPMPKLTDVLDDYSRYILA